MATVMQWMSPRFESELLETEVRAVWEEDARLVALQAEVAAKREALDRALNELRSREDELLRETKERCGITRLTDFEACLGEARLGIC